MLVELVGVPFDGYGRSGHQRAAAGVLEDAGLASAIPGPVTATPPLVLPDGDTGRGADTSLINEPGLVAMVEVVGTRVGSAVRAGRFPILYGGDCSTLLGTVPALREIGDVGLVFVDGHEDAMPLDVSEDGEAANAELGILVGLTGGLLRGPLAAARSALPIDALAVLGVRDHAWRARFNVGSLRGVGAWLRDVDAVAAAPATAGERAVDALGRVDDGWWLHTDLDVLDPEVFPAQGLPDAADEPGGLTWEQLTEVLRAAVARGGCRGWSIAIYDPEQDADLSAARRIVRLVADVMAALAGSDGDAARGGTT